eukprot:Seg3374.1 transcript_id=Seg3374.1/GoldUCD/mRNA.D3Y31 product="hypothetical protein" protein_id=Seg3374.1/GoldUCD/D3Y31
MFSFSDKLEIDAFLRIKEPYFNGTVLNTSDPAIKMGIENKSSTIYQEVKNIIEKELNTQIKAESTDIEAVIVNSLSVGSLLINFTIKFAGNPKLDTPKFEDEVNRALGKSEKWSQADPVFFTLQDKNETKMQNNKDTNKNTVVPCEQSSASQCFKSKNDKSTDSTIIAVCSAFIVMFICACAAWRYRRRLLINNKIHPWSKIFGAKTSPSLAQDIGQLFGRNRLSKKDAGTSITCEMKSVSPIKLEEAKVLEKEELTEVETDKETENEMEDGIKVKQKIIFF